jgi:hypothetical protein
VYATKVRADLLDGKLPCIHVSGYFQEAYNVMAIIFPNPNKPHPIDYTIAEENGMLEGLRGLPDVHNCKKVLATR